MSRQMQVALRRLTDSVAVQWTREQLVRSGLVNARATCRLEALARRPPEDTVRLRSRAKRARRTGHDFVSTEDPKRWLPYADLQEINRTAAFTPLTQETSSRIERQAQEQFNDTQVERKACAVTDAWVFRSEASCVAVSDLPLSAMRIVLAPKAWATRAVQSCYDCSSIDARLRGMLLSPRGCEVEQERVLVWMSTEALRHLQATQAALELNGGRDSKRAKPPRFAIADCFVGGTFAEIDAATDVERQAVSLTQVRGVVKVVYGGPGKMLRSHLLCWDNRSATAASRVPNVPRQENFQVVLAGPMTTQQQAVLSRQHQCDGGVVFRLHELMKRVNPLYATVKSNSGFYDGAAPREAFTTQVPGSDDVDDLVTQARARQASVAEPDEPHGSLECETTVLETQTALLETVIHPQEEGRMRHAFENLTGDAPTYIMRRSTSLLQENDPAFMERLFPHLLPFGIGGLSSQRCHRYSKREIVLHYLSLSTNRFATDPMFKLMMFDYLARLRVKSSVFVRVGQDPAMTWKAMKVTRQQLKTAMENRADQRQKGRLGKQRRPEVPLAADVIKTIHASAAKMWGSNEERDAFQRKVKAMSIMYGAPSVFWTLTPNPNGSIAVAFWTGQDLPSGSPDELTECTVLNMPTDPAMSKLVGSNTVVQTQYYRLCARLLIDVLFGWDSDANRPRAEPGIFGFIEALFYALEQQLRLRIHHHGVAWVAGVPRTKSDWERLLASDDLKRKFEEFSASIFAAQLPVFNDVEHVDCPRGECSGSLRPLEIPTKYKHLLRSSTPAPKVAVCSQCGVEFTDPEVSASVIDRKWQDLDAEHRAVSTPEAVDKIRLRFGGVSEDPATADVQLSRLLLKDQIHAYEHTHSCVKGRAGTKCRYNFFRELTEATKFTEADEMVFERQIGNQWLNPYIPLWRKLLHFNMDARLLWTGNSLQASLYAMQYAVKRQSVMDNVAVVELAFKRRLEREQASLSGRTQSSLGLGRLMSLAYSTSGVMEIGGPLATAILFEGGAAKFSCAFERLALIEGLNIMANEDVQATVVSRQQQLYTDTSIRKYIARPRCLESWCWYDFCAWFRHSSADTSLDASPCCFQCDDPAELVHHVREHGLKKLDYPQVPEIVGPRLPDARHFGALDYREETETYCRMAALLYCPFRTPTRFLDASGSALQHHRQWNPTADPKVRRALEFHQQFYLCLESASEYRARLREEGGDDVFNDADVQQHVARDQDDARQMRAHDLVTVPADMYAAEPEEDMLDSGDGATEVCKGADECDEEVVLMRQVLESCVERAELPTDESERVLVRDLPVTKKDVQRFEDASAVESDSNPAAVSGAAADETTEIAVELLQRATEDLAGVDRVPCERPMPLYATINQVSRYHGLNSLQHMAFAHICVPLLHRIANVPLDTPRGSCFNDSPMIITGAAGTGKSRIVDAVRSLVCSWKRPDCVMVTASTGIAAVGLGGVTMHSSVGLGINQTRLPSHIQNPNDDMLRQWDPIVCVVADELSMTDLTLFGLWEEALRRVKESSQPFGGLITVLMFDYCQLLTVRGTAMFKTSTASKPFTGIQESASRLYRSISKVVYLRENMRFRDDPEWGEWLARARLGQWTPEIRAFIDRAPSAGISAACGELVPVISTDNATRVATNTTATRLAARVIPHPRKVYVAPARLSRDVSGVEAAKIRALPDNQTGNVPLFLPLYVGMCAKVKGNQCISKGVANGATGDVYHIDWDPKTTFTRQSDGMYLASDAPTNVYLRIHNSPNRLKFPGLPLEWPPSVMPVYQVSASFKVNSRSITIKGYPIVPAFGSTVHGVQSQTRSHIVVTDLRPPQLRRVDKHALYVTLSRVTTRRGLFWIGRKPVDADFDYFQPGADVIREDARLQLLARATRQRFRQMHPQAGQPGQ